MESEARGAGHLTSGELAAYLDRALPAEERDRAEAHFAECQSCRAELVGAARLLQRVPRVVRWYLPAGVAAAAALVLMFAPVRHAAIPNAGSASTFREPGVTSVAAPSAIAPRGHAPSVRAFVWSRVPQADHYRLTVVDANGSVLWETQTADTSAVTPVSFPLIPGASYFWKVDAQTRWDRWVASELVEFSVVRPKS